MMLKPTREWRGSLLIDADFTDQEDIHNRPNTASCVLPAT